MLPWSFRCSLSTSKGDLLQFFFACRDSLGFLLDLRCGGLGTGHKRVSEKCLNSANWRGCSRSRAEHGRSRRFRRPLWEGVVVGISGVSGVDSDTTIASPLPGSGCTCCVARAVSLKQAVPTAVLMRLPKTWLRHGNF